MATEKATAFLDWLGEQGVDTSCRERLYAPGSGRKWRMDCCLKRPPFGIALEIDGNAWHTKGGGRHGSQADYEKLLCVQGMGWQVIRVQLGMISDEKHRLWVLEEIEIILSGNTKLLLPPKSIKGLKK